MCGVTPEMCFYPPVFTCILNFYMGGKRQICQLINTVRIWLHNKCKVTLLLTGKRLRKKTLCFRTVLKMCEH